MSRNMEFIDLKSFAERMGISYTTAYDWVKKQVLVQGRHYIRVGRVLRIHWSDELIKMLLDDCRPKEQETSMVVKTERDKSQSKGGSSINWDYPKE